MLFVVVLDVVILLLLRNNDVRENKYDYIALLCKTTPIHSQVDKSTSQKFYFKVTIYL